MPRSNLYKKIERYGLTRETRDRAAAGLGQGDGRDRSRDRAAGTGSPRRRAGARSASARSPAAAPGAAPAAPAAGIGGHHLALGAARAGPRGGAAALALPARLRSPGRVLPRRRRHHRAGRRPGRDFELGEPARARPRDLACWSIAVGRQRGGERDPAAHRLCARDRTWTLRAAAPAPRRPVRPLRHRRPDQPDSPADTDALRHLNLQGEWPRPSRTSSAATGWLRPPAPISRTATRRTRRPDRPLPRLRPARRGRRRPLGRATGFAHLVADAGARARATCCAGWATCWSSGRRRSPTR